ncbi:MULTISPECIES: hypothetical protein [Bacillaceae]|uniref:DUF4129 domain-containing protein n=1 Tax=Evansella alkalicola TaxID=745819 RepID=A0ABS6JXV9_9BACI|nr:MULTISPECIES: hypothetical protein [Bacillaceae]MBU9722052.1 hypothetical protein [Bacillus alkalicola]
MAKKTIQILSNWLQGCIEWLCVAPLLLVLGIFLIPNDIIIMWLGYFPLMILIGLLLRSVFNNNKRSLFIVVVLIINIVISFLLLASYPLTILTTILGLFFSVRGGLYAYRAEDDLFSISYLWLSIVLYFISYFVFSFVDMFHAYTSLLTWLGVVVVFITLFKSNSSHIQDETKIDGKKSKLNAQLKWKNRVFIGITIGIILLIMNFSIVQNLFQGVINVIRYLFEWLSSLVSLREGAEEHTPPPQESIPFLPGDEEVVESTSIFEYILIGLGYILLALAIVFFTYFLFKLLKKLFRFIFTSVKNLIDKLLLRMEHDDNSQTYIDEKESVIDWKDWRSELTNNAKDRFNSLVQRKEKWSKLKNNEEKVRYLYRELLNNQMKLGYDLKRYNTPNETLRDFNNKGILEGEDAELFAESYSQAKYSKDQINDNVVERLKVVTGKKKK